MGAKHQQHRDEAKPYYAVFSSAAHALEAMHDNLDELIALHIDADLQEQIRETTRTLCIAVNALMDDVESIPALLQFSRSANRLEELAEEAMELIEEEGNQ